MLTRWSDIDRDFPLFEDFRRRMERLFEDAEARPTSRAYEAARQERVGVFPPVALFDAGASLVLKAEVPGLGEKDVRVTLNQDVIALEGERRTDVPEGVSVHRRERVPVKFSRSFTLPCKVDAEKCLATVKNGVLTVTLAKATESQPRQIAVRAQ